MIRKIHPFIRGLGLLGIVAIATACQTSEGYSDAEGEGKALPRSGQDIQSALTALPSAQVVDVDSSGVPTFVTGNLGRTQSASLSAGDVRNVLAEIAPVFRADPAQLVLRNAHVDDIGDTHYIFTQQKNGRAVFGGDFALHSRNGVAYAANGTVRDDVEAPTETKISLDAAIATAKSGYPTLTELAASSKGDTIYLRSDSKLDLVYAIEVTGVKDDQTPVRDTVLVNAIDGRVLLTAPHIHTAKNRELHDGQTLVTLPGPLVRIEGASPVADEIVNNNYDRLGTTYDGYFELFGRDSFDNAGAKLISTVHHKVNYVNAFWNGTQMVYGDGDGVNASNLANGLDVTAHELTHAVTEKTSNLTYSGESGGLNESMSDIFGNVIEWYRDGKVVSDNTWKVGEDIWTPNTPGDALRYMNDPKKDNVSIDWYPDYSGQDVHYSSGISNLAFYLLAQGGKHPRGKSTNLVTGIGIEKAARIFFRANTTGIFQASTKFAQAKTGTELAAQQLGYTTAEINSVSEAWKAVGVGIPRPIPPSSPLTNGVPVENLSGATGSKIYYTLEVPAGQNLRFEISGGTGDADLYVKYGEPADTNFYDCRPFLTGNNEFCNIPNAQPGKYWVLINGYAAYTGVKLLATYAPPPPPGRLVINEVEYDEVGDDTQEFVEIYNAGGLPVNLSGYSLYLVNGIDDTSYSIVDLSGAASLNPGQYLVVGSRGVTVPTGVKKINFQGLRDQIQNGAPDGLALVNGTTVVDALSYEGVITTAQLPGIEGTVNLVEGARTTASDSNTVVRSLSRLPNGVDTNNAASDWKATPNVTPGAANN
ncbi:M4 family metallopeptidase [Pendulispora albinea]|uniref:M4 family metallopeptidase n=1 Tax=Pendulispora albinea TaxID=2741071 RepID=A0ABZ2LUD6_9BACT